MSDRLRDIDRWFIASVLPHAEVFRRAAARLVGLSEAEDLVQEAYSRLFGSDRWRDVENPRAFTLTIVRNLGLERLRRLRLVAIEALAPPDIERFGDDSPDALRVMSDRAELAHVFALIDRLPPRCAEVMRMRKIDGLAPTEIAAKLGLSVSTVEKHLTKGLALIMRARRGEECPVDDDNTNAAAAEDRWAG